MKFQVLRGTAADWGLPPARLAELDAELADHAACLVERGDCAAADVLRERVNTEWGRRALTSVHLADQVATTLARAPSYVEWRELTWLLIWFVVIIISDIAAVYATHTIMPFLHRNVTADVPSVASYAAGWVVAAWLLQGLARAGFFATSTVSLVRAWRTGWGVLLARVLQLKLIHTVLVVLAMWFVGHGGWVDSSGYECVRTAWPDWLTAPYLLGYGLGIALVILLVSRLRLWPWALGLVLLTLFLYPASPVRIYRMEECRPIVSISVKGKDDKSKYLIPDDDPLKIAARYEQYARDGRDVSTMDVETNTWWVETCNNMRVPGTVMGAPTASSQFSVVPEYKERYRSELIGYEYNLPLFSANAALAWLAAPIPLLGLVGLLGMLALMGRRSVQDAVLYTLLVFFALASTFLPFFFTGTGGELVSISPVGVVTGPLPGFDSLLIGSALGEVWTLILGLLLSAGIPWLLVALFLKPKPPQLPDGTPFTAA